MRIAIQMGLRPLSLLLERPDAICCLFSASFPNPVTHKKYKSSNNDRVLRFLWRKKLKGLKYRFTSIFILIRLKWASGRTARLSSIANGKWPVANQSPIPFFGIARTKIWSPLATGDRLKYSLYWQPKETWIGYRGHFKANNFMFNAFGQTFFCFSDVTLIIV